MRHRRIPNTLYTMSTQLILQEENIREIIASAPQAHTANIQSHDRCLTAAQAILKRIETTGMTDELDQEAASFLTKAKATVKKMNEQRSHVTKLFDTIRTEFTRLESDLDDKGQTAIATIKSHRDAYARKKHEEAERRRREEQQRQALQSAKETYTIEIEAEYREELARAIKAQYNLINGTFSTLTLDDIDKFADTLRRPELVRLPDDYFKNFTSRVTVPSAFYGIPTLAPSIRNQVLTAIEQQLLQQFTFEMEGNIQAIADMLPSKRAELQRIATLNEAEKVRAAEQMRQREAEMARQREEQQRQAAEAERIKAETAKQQAQLGALFDQAATATPTYQPKVVTKKRIIIDNPQGFLAILNLWWAGEGCTLTVDELTKKFKTMITYCEKMANDKTNPQFIENQFIRYEDEVKAK